jgi:hypothetical protein
MYWQGGTEDEQEKVDIDLRSCVEKVSNKIYSNIMYYGVRFGHYSPIKHQSKWGWGWVAEREFQENTIEDKKLIIKKLNKFQSKF